MTARMQEKPKSIEMLESALGIFWGGNCEEALAAFRKIMEESSGQVELIDKVNTYIKACENRIKSRSFKPKSAEEHYLVGVLELNDGRFDESLKHLNKAIERNGDNDAWIFTLACAHALNGDGESAIAHLSKAINLKEDNRIYALHCPDFSGIRNTAEFQNLLYRSSSPKK
jgi:tetratricopeptide (TPR) repeat protein